MDQFGEPRRTVKPNDKPLTAPKLNVVEVDQLLRPNRGIGVAVKNVRAKSNEMIVVAYQVGSILCHCPTTPLDRLEHLVTATEYCREPRGDPRSVLDGP